MLSKKQYWYTLITAIVIFFVIFLISYFYTMGHVWQAEPKDEVAASREESQLPTPSEVTILPQTKITLKAEDVRTHKQSEARIDSSSLMGLTEEELQEEFKDYTIETFNEKEVTLVKNYSSEVPSEDDSAIYVLGVDGNYVCIKEKGTTKRPVKVDYEINHLSKYVYSLLLNEEIVITSAQKEALMLNPNTIQKILQGYVGE